MATWRHAQVGQITRLCDEVNEGLESCADHAKVPTSWATEFAKVVKIWLSINLEFPKDLAYTL